MVIGGAWLYRALRRASWKRIVIGLAAMAIVAMVIVAASKMARAYHPRPLQFDGASDQLQKTQVAPTLKTPVEPGKNVIWCASFQAVWKNMETDLAKEPLHLPGAEVVEALLNASPVPEVPEGDLYTEVGWENKGIVDTIREEKARRFPGSAVPEFPGIGSGSFVAYGYLQSNCAFSIPYFDSVKPMEFKAGDGTVANIRTFGIRKEDRYAYKDIRKQVGILFLERNASHRISEFALDLCTDSPSIQVVFARTTAGKTLGDTLAKIEAKTASYEAWTSEFGNCDVVLVPEIAFRVLHHFRELEGYTFANAALQGQDLDVALQEIQFRLDRSGAELMSEMKMYTRSSGSEFIGDGPFLIYLKKRGAAWPYFVIWVDNDELLTKDNTR